MMQLTTQPQNTQQQVEKMTQIVDNLAFQLIHQASQRVCEQLTTYMALPHQLNEMNAAMILAGQLDVNDPIASEKHLWRQAKLFPTISYIGFALTDGNREAGAGRWITGTDLMVYENRNLRGYDYATDENGDRTQLVQSYDYDPLAQHHHQQALQATQPIWTDIYTAEIHEVDVTSAGASAHTDDVSSNVGYQNYVAINAEHPFFDASGNIKGLAIVDLLLADISKFLRTLNISPTGQVFLMERDGMLVGSSDACPILHRNNGVAERYSAIATPNPVIRAVAKELQDRFSTFTTIQEQQKFEFELNGERQFVAVTPWQDNYGLDWLVVVSVPESDFITQG